MPIARSARPAPASRGRRAGCHRYSCRPDQPSRSRHVITSAEGISAGGKGGRWGRRGGHGGLTRSRGFARGARFGTGRRPLAPAPAGPSNAAARDRLTACACESPQARVPRSTRGRFRRDSRSRKCLRSLQAPATRTLPGGCLAHGGLWAGPPRIPPIVRLLVLPTTGVADERSSRSRRGQRCSCEAKASARWSWWPTNAKA
jgi:hypothetical protein